MMLVSKVAAANLTSLPVSDSTSRTDRGAVSLVSQGFDPRGIANLHLWFDGIDTTTLYQDASATTPVTSTGQYANAWRDKGPSAVLITNPYDDGAQTPTFAATGLGYNCVTFPGVNAQKLRGTLDGSHLAQYTWFCAIKDNSAAVDWQFAWGLGHDTTAPYLGQDGIGLQHTWQDYEWMSDCREDSSDPLVCTSGGPGTMPTGFHTVYGQFDFGGGNGATESLWVQDTLVGSDTGAKADQAYIAPNRVALGGRPDAEGSGGAFQILCFLGYSRALSASERGKVLIYLRSRYGIQ